jgi:hypothetical protein
MRTIVVMMSVALTGLFIGCLESNPQPTPGAKTDGYVNVSDVKEGSLDSWASDGACDAMIPHELIDLEDILSDIDGDITDMIDPDVCIPECDGKECGPDGCGGICGQCMSSCDPNCDIDEVPYPAPYLCEESEGWCYQECCPDCCGKKCGDDGCGGICGMCGEGQTCTDNQCEELPDKILLQPSCFHVPYLVPAGQPFAIAVGALTVSCDPYDHAEVKVDGSTIQVDLVATKLEGECPPCIFSFMMVVWIDPLDPGLYKIKVGDTGPEQSVIVSSGDLPPPTCTGNCQMDLSDGNWTLAHLSNNTPYTPGCSDYVNLGTPLTFAGTCSESTIDCADWPGPASVQMCNGNQTFFGMEEPWSTTATYCTDPGGWDEESHRWLLGLTQYPDDPTKVTLFLMEGY